MVKKTNKDKTAEDLQILLNDIQKGVMPPVKEFIKKYNLYTPKQIEFIFKTCTDHIGNIFNNALLNLKTAVEKQEEEKKDD